MKDVPVIEGITTIHFPDIEAAYFRSLLDFLYSGQTCVPAADVEHLHDLLDLLQIKPGIWRTGDKNGKETIEVLTRIFTENNQKMDHGAIDMNCNQGLYFIHPINKCNSYKPTITTTSSTTIISSLQMIRMSTHA